MTGSDKNYIQQSNNSSSSRRKNFLEPGGVVNTAASAGSSTSKKILNIDTDSVNENFSPIRPNTKRKRKFKRMALDPDNAPINMDVITNEKNKTGTIKRKKVRSRSACESENKSKIRSGSMDPATNTSRVR